MKNRSSGGAALVEAMFGSWLLTATSVIFLMLATNVYFAASYQALLTLVAQEAAQSIAKDQYWLGMTRPTFNLSETKQKARELADTLCHHYGMPAVSSFDATVENANTPNGTDFVTVNLSVSHVPLPFGLSEVFPGFLGATANATSAYTRELPYAYMNIHAEARPTNAGDTPVSSYEVAMVPCYGFFKAVSNGTPDTAYIPGTVQPLLPNWGFPGQLYVHHFRGLPLEALKSPDSSYYGFSNGLVTGYTATGAGQSAGSYP